MHSHSIKNFIVIIIIIIIIIISIIIIDPELQVINTKPVIKNKLKDFLCELKNLIQTTLVLKNKKIDDRNVIFHLSAKLITDESGIDKVFRPMHQSDMTKIKNYVSKDWIVKTLLEHVLRFLIHRSNTIEK